VWLTAIVALLSSLVGAGAVLIAQSRSIDAQIDQQTRQFVREQESAARDQRLPIYEEFQDAANDYATKSQLAYECQVAQVDLCEVTEGELQDARYRFQRAINKMHVYGSPEAIEAVLLVTRPLPPSLVCLTGDPVVEPVDVDAFTSALRLFFDVMCTDLAVSPESCR
jgi:hypothetical protein